MRIIMTKKEKELYIDVVRAVRSARSNLATDMRDYDCTWPKPIIETLDEAIRYLVSMRPKDK